MASSAGRLVFGSASSRDVGGLGGLFGMGRSALASRIHDAWPDRSAAASATPAIPPCYLHRDADFLCRLS